jgi:hypothetical protein
MPNNANTFFYWYYAALEARVFKNYIWVFRLRILLDRNGRS